MKVDQILPFTESSIFNLIAGGEEKMKKLRLLSERIYTPGIIGINRRTITHWNNQSLLPYPFNEKEWRKMSIYELTWLKCIQRYRAMGLGLEKIRGIKEKQFSFSPFEPCHLFEVILSHLTFKEFPQRQIDEFEKMGLEKFEMQMRNLQITPFSIVVLNVLACREPLSMVVDHEDNFYLVDFGRKSDLITSNHETVEYLIGKSYTTINVQEMVTGVLSEEKFMGKDDVYRELFSVDEIELLDNIRSGNYDIITVEIDGKEISGLKKVKKVKNIPPKELYRLLNYGSANEDIKIIKRGGKWCYVEVTKNEPREKGHNKPGNGYTE